MYDWNELFQPQLVGFCDFVGVDIAPVSKKSAVKSYLGNSPWFGLSRSVVSNKCYFVTKIVLTYCEKKCFSDGENLLKFDAEGQEFAKGLRSLEQFIQTVKCQNSFCW